MKAPKVIAPRRFFYGWVVVAAAFTVMLVGFGVAYSFGTYFEPLRDEFGVDRGSVSLVFSLTGLLYFGLGAITGPLTDRFGPRALCWLAGVLFLVGLGLASQARAIWQVYLTYSLFVGFGVAATYVPAVSTVQRWFVRRRALASGIAVTGIGVGTVLGPLLNGLLISAYGWRTAYLVTALVAGALVVAAAAVMARSPDRLGLHPDGQPAPVPATNVFLAGARYNRTVAQAVRTREFAWLYAAMVLATIPMFLAIAHIVAYAQDAGMELAEASLGLVGMGIGSIMGRLVLSPLGDRLGRRRSYALTVGVTAALTVLWLVVPLAEVWSLLPWGIAFGSAYGAFVALSPTLMADYFGTAHVSGITGVFYTGAGVGSFAGPWLGGVIFDLGGSYRPAILAAALLAAAATLAVLKVPEPERARVGA